jgi:hypothetical protein
MPDDSREGEIWGNLYASTTGQGTASKPEGFVHYLARCWRYPVGDVGGLNRGQIEKTRCRNGFSASNRASLLAATLLSQ